jgi:hypothetical protein
LLEPTAPRTPTAVEEAAPTLRGPFKPQCNPTLSVEEISPKYLGGLKEEDCLGETWADAIAHECLGPFWDKIDALAQATLKFDDAQKTFSSAWDLGEKGKDLVEQVTKLGNLEAYMAVCMAASFVKSSSPEAAATYEAIEATKKAIKHVTKLSDILKTRIEKGYDLRLKGEEKKALDEFEQVYKTGGVAQKLKKTLVKAYNDVLRRPEAVSRSQLGEATEATKQCRIRQADEAMVEAGDYAVQALAKAEYQRAKAIAERQCWAAKTAKALETNYKGGQWNAETGDVPKWQRYVLNNWYHPDIEACGLCGHWKDAAIAAQKAEDEAKRLRADLASVNKACQDLKDSVGVRVENDYYDFMQTAKDALASCDLTGAREAVKHMQGMEDDPCLKAADLRESAALATEIDKRSQEPLCTGVELAGMCHVVYEGQMYKGQWVKPAKPQDQSIKMSGRWDAEHHIYVVVFGSGQRAIGTSSSFSFDDGCQQTPPYQCDNRCEKDLVPGCIYKSRSGWHVKGNVALTPNSATLRTQWYDLDGDYVPISKGTTTCTLSKVAE